MGVFPLRFLFIYFSLYIESLYFCFPLTNAKKINSTANPYDGDGPDGLLPLLFLTNGHA
jgi:hypothetical protein